MSAIEATCAGFKAMADNTVRFSFDVEPMHAAAALMLFRERGTLVAIAALKPAHLIDTTPERVESAPENEHKGGPLAQSAGIICGDMDFQAYALTKGYTPDQAGARSLICCYCRIDSRRFLDHDPNAMVLYGRLMEKFRKWKASI